MYVVKVSLRGVELSGVEWVDDGRWVEWVEWVGFSFSGSVLNSLWKGLGRREMGRRRKRFVFTYIVKCLGTVWT